MTNAEKDGAKPILFNTDMVKAILDGRKTVTRRKIDMDIVNKCDIDTDGTLLDYEDCYGDFYNPEKLCQYKPGDILFVRETWYYEYHMHDLTEGKPDLPSGRYSSRYVYKADNPDYPVGVGVGENGWRPSIHMPKEAARIWLRVTDVRVGRLQDISGGDLLKEGVVKSLDGNMKEHFAEFEKLWDSTIEKSDLKYYGWDANPYVWIIEFEKIEGGIGL